MIDDLSHDGVVFIAGPMSGYRDCNYPLFDKAESFLHRMGWMDVINPADNFERRQDLSKSTYLRETIRQVSIADAICLLPGWQYSIGASLENDIAGALGLERIYLCLDGYGQPYIRKENDQPQGRHPYIG